MRKGKKRIPWVWKIKNDHYGVRKKRRKHRKWGMKQDSTAWKFRTKKSDGNIYSDLRTNSEYFLESILYILDIILNLRKSKVQLFKQCADQSWNEEVMAIWKQLHKAKWSFRNDLEIQLMNSKSNLKWP